MSLPISQSGRRYGCIVSPPDTRDKVYKATKPVAIPKRYSLRQWAGPVKDQNGLGACTGFANAGLREFLYRKYQASDNGVLAPTFSPLFIYYAERKLEGTVHEDSGASMRSGMKVLNSVGVCLEREDPYEPKNFDIEPSESDYAEALHYRGGAYHRLTSVDDMRHCIASGFGFTFGIAVYSSFESEFAARSGWIPIPDEKKEELLGGHALLALAYDDQQGCISGPNSWGEDWGDEGWFHIQIGRAPV